ncbi:MAG: NADPH oxidoreductase [Pseudomonas citronellolis]|nr:MAG: NADPH oxidoreductase [Pseudomonas citronellolis]
MPLLPFSLQRLWAPLRTPLRALVRGGWLREADVDAWLRVGHPGWALSRVWARVEARRWVADDMLELRLRPNGNWRGARVGQHVALLLERDGVRHARHYSLTRVDDGCLELAVRRQPDGRISPYLLDHLAVGALVELGEPGGELSWPTDAAGVLLLAAGSGLTPLLGLLRVALAAGYQAPVTLLHYVREHGQRAFAEALEALAVDYPNFRPQWSLTGVPVPGLLHGRLQPEHLRNQPARHVLACGPAGFIDSVREQLGGQAISLQVEAFSPPRRLADGVPQAATLHLRRGQRQLAGDTRHPLLDQLEDAGLRPASGCRQGICTQCTCTLLDGQVRDLRNGAVIDQPHQSIRLCVSAPLGDVTLDL